MPTKKPKQLAKPTGAAWRLKFMGKPWLTIRVAKGQFSIDFADEGARVLGGVAQAAVKRISVHLQENKKKDPRAIYQELKFILGRMGGIIEVEELEPNDGADLN